MKMKELSALTGITDRTIRYYIDDGLFIPEKYTENYEGRRSYEFTENDVKHLKQIALLRKYGFSIGEIKALESAGTHTTSMIQHKASEIKQRTEEQLDAIYKLESIAKMQPNSIDEICKMLDYSNLDIVLPPTIDEKSAYEPLFNKMKKRNMFFKTFIVAIIILVIILFPITVKQVVKHYSEKTTIEVNSYMNYDRRVDSLLKDNFVGLLPQKELVNVSKVENYKYQHFFPILGDPTFVIHLNCFYNYEQFANEINRLDALSSKQILTESGTVYICNYPDNIEMYNDDKIYDGLAFYFEVAIVNRDNTSIEYLCSIQQDNMIKDETVKNIVSLLNKELQLEEFNNS